MRLTGKLLVVVLLVGLPFLWLEGSTGLVASPMERQAPKVASHEDEARVPTHEPMAPLRTVIPDKPESAPVPSKPSTRGRSGPEDASSGDPLDALFGTKEVPVSDLPKPLSQKLHGALVQMENILSAQGRSLALPEHPRISVDNAKYLLHAFQAALQVVSQARSDYIGEVSLASDTLQPVRIKEPQPHGHEQLMRKLRAGEYPGIRWVEGSHVWTANDGDTFRLLVVPPGSQAELDYSRDVLDGQKENLLETISRLRGLISG